MTLLFLTLVMHDVVDVVKVNFIVLVVRNMGTLKINVSTYMTFPTKLLTLLKPLQSLSQRVNSKPLFLSMSIRSI